MSDTDPLAPTGSELELARLAWTTTILTLRESDSALASTLKGSHLVPLGVDAFRANFTSGNNLAEAQKSADKITATLSNTLSRPISLQFGIDVIAQALEVLSGGPLPKKDIPEHMIPVAEVYETAQKTWGLQRRAVQWYATENFIPKPKRIGREAYYDKRTIYSHFQIISALTSRRFSFSLNQVRDALRKLEQIKSVKGPDGKQTALAAMESFLINHAQYEAQVWAIYANSNQDGSRSLGSKYSKRLNDVRQAISEAISGPAEGIRHLLQKSLLDIEASIEDFERQVPF